MDAIDRARGQRGFRRAIHLLAVLWGLSWSAAQAADAHRAHIAFQRPTCGDSAALPVVPNDPAAVTTPAGRRCYGTHPSELQTWLPEDRYAWLERSTSSPAVWLDLGGVLVDPREFAAPPLGLRLRADAGALSLELRLGDTATLVSMVADAWQEVRAPDGQVLWIRVEAEAQPDAGSTGASRGP